MVADAQLRDTLKDILADARERRRWGSGRLGERGDQQRAGKYEEIEGDGEETSEMGDAQVIRGNHGYTTR